MKNGRKISKCKLLHSRQGEDPAWQQLPILPQTQGRLAADARLDKSVFFFSPQIWYHIGHVLHFGHDDLLAFAIYDIRGKKWRKSRFTGALWQCPRFSFPHRTCGNKSDKIIRLGTLLTELFSEYLKDTLGMRLDKETFICGACQNLNSSWRFIVTQRLGSLAL